MMIYPSVGRKTNVRQSVNKENDSEDDTLNTIADPLEETIKGCNSIFTCVL